MNQLNKEYLDKNRDAYDEIVRAQTATKANRIKYELLRIMQEEFLPGYVFSDSCGSCLFDMVKLIYQRYDAWLEAQPKEETVVENVKATFPKNDPPKNKHHHRK